MLVQLDDGANVACVEIVAEALDTNTILTSQADVADRRELHVGVGETASLAGRVRITVKGYATAGCTGLPSVVLLPQEGVLGPPPFEMPLVFRFPKQNRDGGVPIDAGIDAGVDAGLDAGNDADSGTPDAGQADAGAPDAGLEDGGVCDLTSCSTTVECEFAACLMNGACDRGNRSSSTPCDGGLCNGTGRCVPMSGCAAQQPCDAGLSCTSAGVCSDAGACVPSYAGCVAPPCLRSLNMCAGDGGCAFEVDPSRVTTSCGGSNVCYANGECQPFLRADNVQAARLPWPTRPLHFVNDGGSCVYGWDTSPGGVGAAIVPPTGGITCPWPAQLQPAALSQSGNGPEVIVFSGTGLRVEPNVTLRFVGRRPVAMLVHGDADLEGQINLRAINRLLPGAGADSSLCGLGANGAGDREGGGGGGFLDDGGSGGRISAPNGGAANGNDTIRPLRGGCSGGLGWLGVDAGVGGGGLQVSVRGTLRVLDGGIFAPGLGGPGGASAGSSASAGGGGGSGGAILLQAFALLGLNGFFTANGGGGGEGATRQGSTNSPGNRGADGVPRSIAAAPGGSAGNCCGGNGGNGGAGTSLPDGGTPGVGPSGNTPAGGGGGGSRGRIRIDTALGGSCTLTQTLISPDDANVEGPNTSCTRN